MIGLNSYENGLTEKCFRTKNINIWM